MIDFLKTIFEILPPILGCIVLFVIGFAGSGGDIKGIRKSICWILMFTAAGLAVNAYLALWMLTGNN